MENDKLLKKKMQIHKQKERIRKQEQILKNRERKARISRLIRLGELLELTGVSAFDHDMLLGALLEIQARRDDQNVVNKWRQIARQQTTTTSSQSPIVISFPTQPTDDTIASLKKLNFKWNAFRKEWYGYGQPEELQKEFDDAIIEKVR